MQCYKKGNCTTIKNILILLFFLFLFSLCNKEKKQGLEVPIPVENKSRSEEANTYITNETVTPPLLDYSQETSLPVDFGVQLSVALDVPDLQYVDRYKPIGILFSSMMDKQSVEDNFQLLDSNQQNIEGNFYWSGNKLYFKPYRPLLPGENYTIKISKNAKNFDGISLKQDFIQNFTTEVQFSMGTLLKIGQNVYDASPMSANAGVIIDASAQSDPIIIESVLTGADYVNRVRLFRLGLGENQAYTICDSNNPCNNFTTTTGKYTINLSSLSSVLQPQEGSNIYYYYLETKSGRTYVKTFAFQYGNPSLDPDELQSNGAAFALENNSIYGMHQIQRLLERFIQSDGSHTGDNFTVNGKKFNDFLIDPPLLTGPVEANGCRRYYSDWTSRNVQYLRNFGPYCNMKFKVCVIGCSKGYADNYLKNLYVPPKVGNNPNMKVQLDVDSSRLTIRMKAYKLNGTLWSYIHDTGLWTKATDGKIMYDNFKMNVSSRREVYANTTLSVNQNGDMVITILGGPSWNYNDPNFNVQQWINAIDSTSDWGWIKAPSKFIEWIINIFVPGVIDQLTPKIVQGTVKDTIENVSANLMNAVLSKIRVDNVNDGINICLPDYLPPPLNTICLTVGAKMKPDGHIGWESGGIKGIRALLEANMTVKNTNLSWKRPPALIGPGKTGFLKFMPSSFGYDASLLELFASKNYLGALVALNPDVVNQAAYGLWKEGAFNFIVDKPTLQQINNVAGVSNLTILADKLLKADAILTVVAPGQNQFQIRDNHQNIITIDRDDPIKIETLLLYPPDLNPLPNWKKSGNSEEYLKNNVSFIGFRLKLIGGKDNNGDGVPDYDLYTIATVIVNLSTKATINFIPYSNPNNYIPACSDGHCRALSIDLSTNDTDLRYTIEVQEDSSANPLGLDPRAIYDVFNPLIKSFVAPLVANVLKEIPFDPDMSACGIQIQEVTVEPVSTTHLYPLGLLNVRLGEVPFSGDCDF